MISKKDTLFIKGLSILLLVFHHNWYDLSRFSSIRSGFRVVVWIFLFISSYGFASQLETTQNRHPFKFVLKRLILLYVPLWICNIVNLIFSLCFNAESVYAFFSGSPLNWISDLFNVSQYFGTPGLLSGWYINMLVLIIVTFPLIYFIVTKLKWFSIALVLALVWLFKWKIYYEYGGYLDEYLLIVVLGILFQKYRVFKYIPKINNIFRIPFIALSILVFTAVLCLRNEYIPLVSKNIFLRFDPLSTVMALGVITAVYAFRHDDKVSFAFEKLGSYSADIFYIHSVFYNVVFPALGISNPIITFLLCFTFTLLISVAIESVKKETDFNRRLRTGIDKILKNG